MTEDFNISDINSEIAAMIQQATVAYDNTVEGCEDCNFNVVSKDMLIQLIEKRFTEKFNVYFD